MAHDGIFDIVGVDVETGDQNHVLLAVDQFEEAFLIEHAHITGFQPAIVRERRCGFIRTVPVALHHLRALDQHLARLAARRLIAVVVHSLDPGIDHRFTDEPFLMRRLGGRGNHHRRGLGQTVTFTHHTAGPLLPATGNLGVQRRATGVDPLQATEIDVVEFGVVHQRHEQ